MISVSFKWKQIYPLWFIMCSDKLLFNGVLCHTESDIFQSDVGQVPTILIFEQNTYWS